MGSLRQYAGSPFGAISRTEAAAIARRDGIAARPGRPPARHPGSRSAAGVGAYET